MISKPTVSVILPSYNKVNYLPTAIDSVLAQTYADFELLVIDDNSDDGALGVIQRYVKQDKRVIYLKTDLDPSNHDVILNRYAHNINRALKHAEGRYISYLCNDNWYLPTRLERMVAYLDSKPDVVICYGIQQIADDTTGELKMGALREAPKVLFDACQRVDQSSVMHRAELLSALGPSPWWPEGVETWRMGDAAFFAKLRDGGIPFFRVPGKEPTDVHRYNRQSITWALDHPVFGPNAQIEGAKYVN